MKKILLPHQYYYPHMNLFENRATSGMETNFLKSLDNSSLTKEAMIYVHIPFCDSKCA
jgi:anaerobilin synthase